jgi:hypothetical protein
MTYKCYCCKNLLGLPTKMSKCGELWNESGILVPTGIWKEIPNVWKCKKCKHIFRHYKGDEDLTKYYTEDYRKTHPLYPEKIRNKYTDKIIDFLMDYMKDKDVNYILEIGSADGFLTKKLKDKFDIDSSNISVCELSDEHCDTLEDYGFDVHRGNFMDLDFEVNYDMIVGIDVIEHIKDIKNVPYKFLDMVSDTGKILLQLPYDRSISDPNLSWDGHFHYFTKDSIRALFENDFIIESIYETSPGESAHGKELIVLLGSK